MRFNTWLMIRIIALATVGLAIFWTTRSCTLSWNTSREENFSATYVLVSGEVSAETASVDLLTFDTRKPANEHAGLVRVYG